MSDLSESTLMWKTPSTSPAIGNQTDERSYNIEKLDIKFTKVTFVWKENTYKQTFCQKKDTFWF